MLNTILDGDGKLVDQYPPTLTPLPALELIKALQLAVVRSAPSRVLTAPDALERLQMSVLWALAKFECEMGGVL